MRKALLACIAYLSLAVCGRTQEANSKLRLYYPVPMAEPGKVVEADVCVYGGTPGGVGAAIQASREGKKAVFVVFRKHVGGMTSGGLTATDVGRAEAIGGMAMEFYKRVGKMRFFNSSKAEEVFRAMLEEAKVPIYFEHRLAEVVKDGNRITAFKTENGVTFKAKMFVDATYEGDLYAKAGVSYTVGREGNAKYKETINGVQFHKGHNFILPIDPYRTPGDPKSGLLWGISSEAPGKPGEGDRKMQAYNFRMLLSNKDDRIAFPKPAGYDRDKYLLLLRYMQTQIKANKTTLVPIQLHTGDCNNEGAFSSDNIGRNYGWPEGDYATREKIYQDHVNYQQGLMWFLANDPETPEAVQKKVKQWGLMNGEFPETGGWPHELYVREGRRMISDYVMTEHNCAGRILAEDSVGMGSYNMDSHNCQRVVVNGHVKNEGDVQIGCPHPYPISYRSIVPKEAECANLFVPVALSSTHISYGSIRMEPVFMILGQSSGTAASMAIDNGSSVQKVDYQKLRVKLLADKQTLDYTGPKNKSPKSTKAPNVDLKTVSGIVVDNDKAEVTGEWGSSRTVGPFVGDDYLHDNNEGQGKKSVKYVPTLPSAGVYDVYLIWPAAGNRASNVAVEIRHAEGTTKATINQKTGGDWAKIATARFNAGGEGFLIIRNDGANGHVVADAARWVLQEGK